MLLLKKWVLTPLCVILDASYSFDDGPKRIDSLCADGLWKNGRLPGAPYSSSDVEEGKGRLGRQEAHPKHHIVSHQRASTTSPQRVHGFDASWMSQGDEIYHVYLP